MKPFVGNLSQSSEFINAYINNDRKKLKIFIVKECNFVVEGVDLADSAKRKCEMVKSCCNLVSLAMNLAKRNKIDSYLSYK